MLSRLLMIGVVSALGMDATGWSETVWPPSCPPECDPACVVTEWSYAEEIRIGELLAADEAHDRVMPVGLDAFALEPPLPLDVPDLPLMAGFEPPLPEGPDDAFARIVEDQVAGFQIDDGQVETRTLAAAKNPAAALESVGDEERIAVALELELQGMPEFADEQPIEAEGTTVRLDTAMRLTEQAMHAWMSVFQVPLLVYRSTEDGSAALTR